MLLDELNSGQRAAVETARRVVQELVEPLAHRRQDELGGERVAVAPLDKGKAFLTV